MSARWSVPLGIALAATLLVWGALPYLPAQIDDAWIVFAYAWRVAEHGEVAWSTGDRVEGFSSWLHLGMMTLGALAGLDLSVLAKALSIGATALALTAVVRPGRGPTDAPGRLPLLLALACWQPLHFWTTQQLETMVAAALAAWAWPGVGRGGAAWARSVGLLGVYSLTRPEGAAWLGVALLVRVGERRPLGRPDLAALATVLALVAFHTWRAGYFGAFWPTPYLVKLEGPRHFGDGLAPTASQLASAALILGLLLVHRTHIPRLAWVPLLLQTALLLRASGDWMGNGRFLLPAVLAAVTTALREGTPIPPGWRRPALLLLLPVTFLWEPDRMGPDGPGWRPLATLRHPMNGLRTPLWWSYPVLAAVERIVAHVPEGAAVELTDVGAPGNVPGVRVLDASGLVDRAVAEALAHHAGGGTADVMARYAPEARLACVRYLLTPGEEEAADLGPLATFTASLPAPDGFRWRCRSPDEVPLELQVARWAAMSARFPAQAQLRLAWAHTVAKAGDLEGAARAAGALGTQDAGVYLLHGAAGYDRDRGWALVAEGALESLLAPAEVWTGLDLVLDADDPGDEGAIAEVGWVGACEGPVTVVVRGPVTVPLPPCDAARRLVVRFTNDRWIDGEVDRNLWVRLPPRR